MRLRTLALALATGAAALGGSVAAAGSPTTVYFQMEGACNVDPPRVLHLKQTEEFSGACFPVAAGTAGQAGGTAETYNSAKDIGGLKLVKGQAIAGQFRFMNFFEAMGAPGPSVGAISFSVTITAKIGGKTVTLVEFSESNSPVAGTEKVFEFTGEVPEGGTVRTLTAEVTASGNTALAMGYDHGNSFFTIG